MTRAEAEAYFDRLTEREKFALMAFLNTMEQRKAVQASKEIKK